MKRGIVQTKESDLVALWVPIPLLRAIDSAVAVEDTDRSKFIRRAIRHKLQEIGIQVEEPTQS